VTRSSRRRLVGAGWFGLWGAAAAGFVYLVPALDRPGVLNLPMVLFVLLPGLAALPAGALVGPGILDVSRTGPGKAVALGLLAAVIAHLVFAPLFALGMWLEAPGNTDLWGLWMATTVLGFPMTGTVTLPAGALAGWLLHLVGRRLR
jgi:hypothetical protein